MRAPQFLGLMVISLMLSGCLVRTAADIVTAPIRIGARAVDLMTTSQSESDEKLGREVRRRDERLGTLEREFREQSEDCEDGDRGACRDAQATGRQMRELMRSSPANYGDD